MSKVRRTWGWMSAFDVGGLDPNIIENPDILADFMEAVITEIEMVPLSKPHVVYCSTTDPLKVGYSGFQLLQDSNISFHACPAIRHIYIDVFSCKWFDPKVVEHIIHRFFNPKIIQHSFIERKEFDV